MGEGTGAVAGQDGRLLGMCKACMQAGGRRAGGPDALQQCVPHVWQRGAANAPSMMKSGPVSSRSMATKPTPTMPRLSHPFHCSG